jgi:hypothetical protein
MLKSRVILLVLFVAAVTATVGSTMRPGSWGR